MLTVVPAMTQEQRSPYYQEYHAIKKAQAAVDAARRRAAKVAGRK